MHLRWLICVLLGVAAAPAAAAPASATANAQVKVTVTKPLVLTFVQDLSLGTVLIQDGAWANATVGISRVGAFTCSPNITCSGAAQVATYRVAGTNNQAVNITAPDVVLVNQSDATKTLTMTVDSPQTVLLPNSGNPGVDFSIGGSIALSPSTVDGTYSGTFNVTVDY